MTVTSPTIDPAEAITPPSEITANHEVTKQIRGSSLLVLGRLSSLATNLVVQVLLVRTLTKDDFGTFSYVLSLVTTGATLCTFGLDRGLSRFLAMYEERGDRAKFWGTIVLQTATIAGVGLAFTAVAVGLRSWVGGTLLDD
ncbi:MAG: oligosaccharide flippase family protein, partial [Aquihabitans sp.]